MLGSLWRRVRSTASWLASEPWRLVVVVAGLLVGAGAGVPTGNRTYDYMWNDARFCDDCHVHDYANEAWARSAHAQLTTCHDCHRVPISHYPRNLWVTITDPPQTRDDIHAPHIPIVVCAQCHLEEEHGHPLTGPMPEETREHVVKVDQSVLHQAHLEAKSRTPSNYQGGNAEPKPPDTHAEGAGGHGGATTDTIDCMDCHGTPEMAAHQFEPSPDTCTACHSDLNPAEHGPGNLPCLQCHIAGFLAATP